MTPAELAGVLPALTPTQLARVVSRLSPRSYAAGTVIVREGEAADDFYILIEGEVAVLKLADPEYTFVDEWDVSADPETVFDILADGHTYPEWWKPVYIDVKPEGNYTLQHFKGRLPNHLLEPRLGDRPRDRGARAVRQATS